METFNELNLPPELAQTIEKLGFTKPTPIQAQAIPHALAGRDLIGCAQTGSGKTLAFSIPLLTRLLQNPDQIGLILTPTRELALQISQVFKQLFQHLPRFRGALIIGGESMRGQLKALQDRPQIIVATPGRLVDHINRGNNILNRVSYLVLDEADRMLDMGFAPQLDRIMEDLRDERQTLLFSATFPQEIRQMASKYLQDPTRIDVAPKNEGVSPQIKQRVVQTDGNNKGEALLKEIKDSQGGTMIVFARTKIRAERVARLLRNKGISSGIIHGDRTQGQRRFAIEGFRNGEFKVLVATDIAARGIDVPSITHVINFDLPQQPDDYVHRIGRTGRAGATGEAVSFLTPEDAPVWRQISRLVEGKSSAGAIPGAPMRSAHGGGGGGGFKGKRPFNRTNKGSTYGKSYSPRSYNSRPTQGNTSSSTPAKRGFDRYPRPLG